jgi:hypothetical protein
MSEYKANLDVEEAGLRKPQAKKTMIAHRASPGYLPSVDGRSAGICLDVKPKITVAMTPKANRNLRWLATLLF